MREEGCGEHDVRSELLRAMPPPLRLVRGDLRQSREIERASQVAMTQEAIARVFKVPVAEMRAPTRRAAPVAEARQIAMYLMHVVFGMSLSAVGRHFGRDRTTAAHACRQIEDRRDDTDFDLLVDRLEFAIRAIEQGGLRQ